MLLVLQRLGLARVPVDFLSLSLVTFRTLFHFRVSTATKQGITPWSARRYAPRRWQYEGGKNRGGSAVHTSLVAGGG